jgi:hypothetical protein
MQAVYVEPQLTPLTFEDAAQAMRWALTDDATKQAPSDETLALALAKTALETGRWKAIWNDNWGNIKAGDKYVGMYTCIVLNEVLNGKVVWFAPNGQLSAGRGTPVVGAPLAVPPGHPQTRMRAYANQYDGALAYVEFVKGGRYAAAWQKLLAGDAVGYVHALKVAGYFTADEATYTKAVVALQKEMLAKLRAQPHDEVDLDAPEYNPLRNLHVIDHYVDAEYERIRAGFNAAQSLREYEGSDTEPPTPDAEPNS